MFNKISFTTVVLCLLLPQYVFAYGRGGSCGYSSLCTFTGALIGIIVLGFIIISIATNIRNEGLVKGVKEHPAAIAVFWYLVVIVGMVFLLVQIAKFHKELAILIGIMLMFFWPIGKRKSVNHEH